MLSVRDFIEDLYSFFQAYIQCSSGSDTILQAQTLLSNTLYAVLCSHNSCGIRQNRLFVDILENLLKALCTYEKPAGI